MTPTPAPEPTNMPLLGAWQPLPAAGTTPHTQATESDLPNPLYDRLIYGKTPADWAIRIVLALVMTAALAVGTWSIYTLLTQQLHAPQPIAILGCGMFDVAALFFALLSQRYAVTTDSGLAPRAAMLAMVSTSSWVNWQHGQLEGWGTVGSVILAAAPVIAELAFEMFHRYAHRETLRRLGRVAQTLPVLGKWAWIAHPFRSRKTIDAHIRAALTEHEAVAERREDLATERAALIVTVPVSGSAHTEKALTLTRADAQPALTDAHPAPLASAQAPALERAQEEAAALTPDALTKDAHLANAQNALNHTRSTVVSAPIERAHADAQAGAQPKPRKASPRSERAQADAQNPPSLTDRKALKEQQDTLTLALYETLNRRPEWTDIRDALMSAGLAKVSRPTAQRIRERVENAHPDLPRERATLTGSN